MGRENGKGTRRRPATWTGPAAWRTTVAERNSFLAMAIALLGVAVAVPFFGPRFNLVDVGGMFFGLAIMAAIARRKELPLWTYWAAFGVFAMHSAAILGLFGVRILGIGFDKWLHLYASIGLALFLWHWFPIREKGMRALIVFLCVMGVSAMTEVGEFVGTVGFGIEYGGITAMGDTLPPSDDPLQTYDAYFDLIFNAVGALVGILVAVLLGRRRRKSPRGS